MTEPASLISVIAAVASAIGGAVACVAAFRSAGHAKMVFEESQKADKRVVLRQLALTAYQVSVEVERIKWLAQGLTAAYRDLAMFSGANGGSRETLYKKEIGEKVEIAERLQEKAKPFVEFQIAPLNGPLDEINSREVAMSQCLSEAVSLREKIEIELADIQAHVATRRESALSR